AGAWAGLAEAAGTSGTWAGPAETSGTSHSSAVRITRVPHPDGSSLTVPLARSPSQATVVSGSSLVILISPNLSRWRCSDCASLHSAHSSGGDLSSVRLAV